MAAGYGKERNDRKATKPRDNGATGGKRKTSRRDDGPADYSRLFDRQPPHDIPAECATLGSLMLDPIRIGDVMAILPDSSAFYRQSNAAIFTAIIEAYDANKSLDMVMLNAWLTDRDMIEQVGGVSYLVELVESVPSSESAEYYARRVRDKWLSRQVIETAGKMLDTAYNQQDKPVEDLLDESETAIFQIARNRVVDRSDLKLGDHLQAHYDQLAARSGESIVGVPTGFYDLDDLMCGMQRGDLLIIAGRPSMGKTAIALCIANHIAVTEGVPVGFFSMEMSREQVGNRLLCMHSAVDSHKLRRNQLDTDDFHQLAKAVGVLTDAPLYVDDSPGMSIVTLRAKARRMTAKYDIGVIFVDYLQLMSSPGGNNRQEEVSAISRGLKALAREINVPVVCLSQLNRQSEGRVDRRPRMSDLRESGAIEQDADVIALMHREDYYNRGDDDYTPNNVAEVIIEKQRQGPTGTIKLHWHGPTTSLHNLSTSSDLYEQSGSSF